MSLARLNQIEAIIASIEDKAQLSLQDTKRLVTLEAEADELADEIELADQKRRQELRNMQQAKDEQIAKIKREKEERFNLIAADITELKRRNSWDEMFNKYGHEFINDYEGYDDGTVISFVSLIDDEPQMWQTDCSYTKIKYLVNHRLYTKYVRAK